MQLRSECHRDDAGFIGPQAPDAHLAVVLDHFRLRIRIAWVERFPSAKTTMGSGLEMTVSSGNRHFET